MDKREVSSCVDLLRSGDLLKLSGEEAKNILSDAENTKDGLICGIESIGTLMEHYSAECLIRRTAHDMSAQDMQSIGMFLMTATKLVRALDDVITSSADSTE
ncbi:hypothetical protein JOE25_001842 [Serratia sp. PL17]|uniref:hypothetical protein n=1 Tax=Serratia sp. PL17 TaxID=2806582 RepID=UPI001AEA4335|nr:hypothetical protein [Serratia sp. PL17]MBP1130283.1 hypothetical protein [Serratia sp. PL17]